jgi:hypothetical protein
MVIYGLNKECSVIQKSNPVEISCTFFEVETVGEALTVNLI